MIPQRQLNRHNPANGEWGDCWRTCIACILDLRPEEVPHFFDGDVIQWEGIKRTQEWLIARGMYLLSFGWKDDWDQIQLTIKTFNPGIHYIMFGMGSTEGHVVICKDGEIVHDPSGFFYPLNPLPEEAKYWTYFIGKVV